VVANQIFFKNPSLSFGHNLHFKCPNGSCKPILDIYVSIIFQLYKVFFNAMGFDLFNQSLNIPKVHMDSNSQHGSSFGSVSVHSHTPQLPSWPMPLQDFALVASPKLGLRHYNILELRIIT
jgi:hypothetical protein